MTTTMTMAEYVHSVRELAAGRPCSATVTVWDHADGRGVLGVLYGASIHGQRGLVAHVAAATTAESALASIAAQLAPVRADDVASLGEIPDPDAPRSAEDLITAAEHLGELHRERAL